MRDQGGAAVVRRVLTLGSPHHGTDVGGAGRRRSRRLPDGLRAAGPDSDLLRRLNAGDETPAGPQWVTIRSTSDQVVTPTDSAGLEGALNLRGPGALPGASTSHGDLPGDPVVLAALPPTLGGPRPSRAGALATVSLLMSLVAKLAHAAPRNTTR